MIFLIATFAIFLPVLLGGVLAWLVAGADGQVTATKLQIEEKDKAYNPIVTLGHKIKAQASKEMQLLEARRLAAKKAAQTARGANMRIGQNSQALPVTAGKAEALADDPLTAVRIAAYHGWDGAKMGAVIMENAPKAAGGAGSSISRIKLTPGKDYAKIDITDSMSLAEKRKARIANAKARSAAIKAAKAAGVAPTPYGGQAAAAAAAAPAASAAPVAAAPASAQPAPTAAAVAAINVPPPQLIELNDSLSPDELRKARISNSKATSAFNKALKEAGIDPKSVEVVDGKVVLIGAAPAASAAAPAAATEAAAPTAVSEPVATAAAAVPEPQYIAITDDMSPDELRKARITNSKLKSEYNKALKAAGIDPKSLG